MADARTSIHDITVDLLEDILLRVSSPPCLVRAGATCKLWRRVIADPHFTGRFRSLHKPAVAGYYFNTRGSFITSMPKPWTSICPSFQPLPSTTTAAGIDPRHLSLDFLSDVVDGLHQASLVDSRGGLLLIEFQSLNYLLNTFPDALVVCEPLTRRYTKIPRPRDFDGSCVYWRSFLVDGDGGISMSNFRVLCEMYRGDIARAAVFTAGGDSGSWKEKDISHVLPKLDYTRRRIMGHAGGSWYFYSSSSTEALVVLDGRTGDYTFSDLPTTVDWDLQNNFWKDAFYVTEGRDGKPRIFYFWDNNNVKVFARLGGHGEWALERGIYLLHHHQCYLNLWVRGPGFIVVAVRPRNFAAPKEQFFSVDLETMEAKPAAAERQYGMHQFTLPCPPALHACLD